MLGTPPKPGPAAAVIALSSSGGRSAYCGKLGSKYDGMVSGSYWKTRVNSSPSSHPSESQRVHGVVRCRGAPPHLKSHSAFGHAARRHRERDGGQVVVGELAGRVAGEGDGQCFGARAVAAERGDLGRGRGLVDPVGGRRERERERHLERVGREAGVVVLVRLGQRVEHVGAHHQPQGSGGAQRAVVAGQVVGRDGELVGDEALGGGVAAVGQRVGEAERLAALRRRQEPVAA
jgi:hypothetical protein